MGCHYSRHSWVSKRFEGSILAQVSITLYPTVELRGCALTQAAITFSGANAVNLFA
jgi:hypothetical protein